MNPIWKQLERAIGALPRHRLKPSLDCRCRTQRLGSDYGGWEVAADHLDNHSVVYSVGIGEDVSFDIELIEHFGMRVFAFDPTPQSIDWIEEQTLPKRFRMHPFGVASFDGNAWFHPPDNPAHVSHTMLRRMTTDRPAVEVPVKRLVTIMQELGHQKIDLLKMDIEGAEYDVLRDMIRSEIRPHQILVEFHHRFPDVCVKWSRDAIRNLRDIGYRLFYISERSEEFGFLRDCPP